LQSNQICERWHLDFLDGYNDKDTSKDHLEKTASIKFMAGYSIQAWGKQKSD